MAVLRRVIYNVRTIATQRGFERIHRAATREEGTF